jgi:predicted dehydrogenase
MVKKTKIGIVGCGNISGIYLKSGNVFRNLEVAACADVLPEAAKAKADEFKVKALSVPELLASKDLDIVVNLTIPKAHGEVALAAVQAGKHVYNEKPLAVELSEAGKLLEAAKAKNLRVGCAPDTFLGGGLQTCRKLVDEGWIGKPVAAVAFMLGHGMEGWHPNPDFFFQPGAGPMFDMGPYYLTALVNLMGPVKRVAASAKASFAERTITAEGPRFGQKIKVTTPTHVAGVMDFESGAVATMVTSFDVWHHELPRIEVYGSEGSLSVPDPNTFGGPVRLRRAEAEAWSEIPLSHGYAENSRGLGVADMAAAIAANRGHRASGELAGHVLEVMHAFLDSAKEGRHVEIKSRPAQPKPLPLGLGHGEID